MAYKQINWLELFFGTIVILVTFSLLIFAYFTVRLSGSGTSILASFEDSNGLHIGSDVRISGIRVGSVASMKLNPVDNWALVEMRIYNSVKIPKDSSARMTIEGILGGVFIEIDPGGSQEYLQAGDYIQYTHSIPNIIDLITNLFLNFNP